VKTPILWMIYNAGQSFNSMIVKASNYALFCKYFKANYDLREKLVPLYCIVQGTTVNFTKTQNYFTKTKPKKYTIMAKYIFDKYTTTKVTYLTSSNFKNFLKDIFYIAKLLRYAFEHHRAKKNSKKEKRAFGWGCPFHKLSINSAISMEYKLNGWVRDLFDCKKSYKTICDKTKLYINEPKKYDKLVDQMFKLLTPYTEIHLDGKGKSTLEMNEFILFLSDWDTLFDRNFYGKILNRSWTNIRKYDPEKNVDYIRNIDNWFPLLKKYHEIEQT
jgi:hypothetical protein